MSARDRVRRYFENHVGEVLTSATLREVGAISEWARRVRELRNEEGMQIHTCRDDASLKPDEYRLVSLNRDASIARGITPQLRIQILERNGFTCQLCGAGAGDPDDLEPSRKVRLHIDHIVPVSQGGTNTYDNLRAVCSTCNQARSNIQPPSEDARNLLARIRKAPRSVQKEIYKVLKRTFHGV